jgi:hypothetical protein
MVDLEQAEMRLRATTRLTVAHCAFLRGEVDPHPAQMTGLVRSVDGRALTAYQEVKAGYTVGAALTGPRSGR